MQRRTLPVLPATAGGAAGAPAPVDSVASAGAPVAAVAGAGLRVAMITLGCDKNTVDSERLLGGLLGAGAELAAAPEDADVVVVNTCGFIEMAKQESVDTLLQAARLKEAGRVRAVVGLGCLVQRYRTELEKEIPEVDLFLGLTDADRLVPELARLGYLDADVPLMERPLRVLTTTSSHSSHLKISEGCDHGCAFCAIPLMRGKFRSTPIDVLVREAQELERQGVVELNIVSQDTTWYGRDWARALGRGEAGSAGSAASAASAGAYEPAGAGGYFMGRPFDRMPNLDGSRRASLDRALGSGTSAGADGEGPVRPGPISLEGVTRTGALPHLLRTLLAETDVPWYRLFYMYPSGITDELVELMASAPRILPYLDMPIQHGDDAVLRRMRRPERRSTIVERVARLRDAIPGLALRTTVIVGFPGETEDEFESLLDLLETLRFDHVGAFAYSEEEDTPAASMPGAVPAAIRRERLERVLDLQRVITAQRNEERVGRVVTVLVDESEDEGAVGRGAWQAPEVDGVVRIEDGAGLEPGSFVQVEITGADEYDLTGVVRREERTDG